MKTEAEVGGMWPRAWEYLEPPGDGGGRGAALLEPLEGACPHRHLGPTSGLQGCGEHISVVLSHRVGGDLLQQEAYKAQ